MRHERSAEWKRHQWETGRRARISLCLSLSPFFPSLPFDSSSTTPIPSLHSIQALSAPIDPNACPTHPNPKLTLPSLPPTGCNQPTRLRRQPIRLRGRRARRRLRRLLLDHARIQRRRRAVRQRAPLHDHRRVSGLGRAQRRAALQAVQGRRGKKFFSSVFSTPVVNIDIYFGSRTITRRY